MNQGIAQPQDPLKPNDTHPNLSPSINSSADSQVNPPVDTSTDSFTGSLAVSPSCPRADSPDGSSVASSSDSPTDIYSILSKIPCLQNQGFMEAVNALLQKKSLAKNWIKIVGTKLAEHTAPVMQGRKLIVIVNEPRWMAALQQIEGILSKKVNEFLKSSQPVDLELRLGKISAFPRSHTSSAIVDRKLTSEQAVNIENLLCPIKNNERLKQTLKNVLVRHCHHNQNFLDKN